MLDVRLIGGLEVCVDDHPVVLPSRRSAHLLIAWLALHPGEHARNNLAELFWPDVLSSSARASLRAALASLRESLGPGADRYLLANRERLGLREVEVDVDVRRFRRALAEGRSAEALRAGDGELLQGYGDEWVLGERDRHRDDLVETLGALAHEAEEAQDLVAAIALDRRRVALDPLAEPAVRDLMRRLAAAGDRASALASFAALSDRFRRDLRALPSRETRDLGERIRQSEPAAAPTGAALDHRAMAEEPLPLSGPWAAPPPTVTGRRGELARIDGILARWSPGSTQVMLLEGEPGVGKTAVLHHLVHRARARGASVVVADVEQHALGYGALSAALDALAGAARSLGPLPPETADLMPLAPTLAHHVNTLSVPPLDLAEPDTARVVRAFVATIGALGRGRPLVLVVDAAERADDELLAVIEALLSGDRDMPLFLAVAARTTEGPARRVLARIARLPDVDLIELERLDPAGTALLGRQLSGRPLTAEEAEAFHLRTGGNPLLIRTLLAGGSHDLVVPGLPESVGDLIADRIRGQPDSTRRALEAGAVAGEHFDVEMVAKALEATEHSVLDALDAAARVGVVAETADAPGRFDFVHQLFAEALRAELSAARAVLIHRRIANELERRDRAGLDVDPGVLAEHLLAAGPSTCVAAARHAIAAAEHGVGLHAHHRALELLTRAEAGLSRWARGRRRDRAELLVRIAEARWQCGRWADVRLAALDAAALASELDDGPLLGRATLALCAVPYFPGTEGVDHEAVELLERARESIGGRGDSLAARLTAQLARELRLTDDRDRVIELAEEARAAARQSGDPRALVAALDSLHVAHAGAGDAALRLDAAHELVELAGTSGLVEPAVRGRVWLAVDRLELGDVAALEGQASAVEEIAASSDRPGLRWWPALWRASALLCVGDLERGWSESRRALRIGRAIYGPAAVLEHQAQTFWCHWQRDSLASFESEAHDAIAAYPGVGTWRCLAALIAAEAGTSQAGGELFGDGLAALAAEPNWLVSAMLLAEVCAFTGAEPGARALLDLLTPFGGRWAVAGYASACLGPVSAGLALLAAIVGDESAARDHWGRAVRSEEAAGSRLATVRFARRHAELVAPLAR